MRIFDVLVIGAGRSGLAAAKLLAAHGMSVAVVERDRPGGRYGEHARIASAFRDVAAAVRDLRSVSQLGLDRHDPTFRYSRIARHVREITAQAPTITDAGIEVVPGTARFERANVVAVGRDTIHGKSVVLAAGSRPTWPEVLGLDSTNAKELSSLADLAALPATVAFVGVNPECVVMAQALARLGSKVLLIRLHNDAGTGLGPYADEMLERILTADGVEVIAGLPLTRVESDGGETVLQVGSGEAARRTRVEQMVVSPRLTPDTDALELRRGGIESTGWGVHVDDRLRTSVRSIWAIGGVAGEPCLPVEAVAQARFVAHSIATRGRARYRAETIVHCVDTDPEVAVVGVEARGVAPVDPQIDGYASWTEAGRPGLVRLVAAADGRFVGATILTRRARPYATVLATALRHGLSVADLAAHAHDGPVGTAIAEAARELLRKRRLPRWRRVTRFLRRG